MKNTSSLFVLAGAIVALLLPSMAQAQADFQILDPVQSGAPGTTKTFHATITNIGSTDLYLNSDSTNAAPGLSLDDTFFFANFPLVLTPGQSVTDALFQVTLASLLAPGDYFGSFTLQGGADGNASGELGTRNFQVTSTSTASSTPEPGTLALLLGMGAAGATFALRRRRS